MLIARVALDVPLATLFDYSVAEGVEVKAGQRVVVPFGKRQLVGVVMSFVATSEVDSARIKQVERVLEDSAALSPDTLTLLNFCSDYYRYPIGQTVMSAIPARLRNDNPIVNKTNPKYRLCVNSARLDLDAFPKRKVVQRRILAKLTEQACNLAQLKALSVTAGKQLKVLLADGWVEQVEEVTAANISSQECDSQNLFHTFNNAHILTDEQQKAVDTVAESQGYGCFLLYGITGSGKTEVYVHLINQILKRAGQVLLLVPEINLTPQLENYFRSRFPDVNLISLHSGLSEGERFQNWQQAQQGAAQVVLGTRLSVFAELPRLALMIVDEEHDGSFKQQDGLRYSARDVAIFRASQRGIPIVLGSATPSLESYHNALTGRYRMLKLTSRAQSGSTLPVVRCVNSNQAVMIHGLSENLLREISLRMARKEQSLLFINRRGYAPVLMCTECGWLSGCKNCAGKMVLHLKDRRLRCHHCGYQVRVPNTCPECGNTELHPVGSGTQRVENVLQERFPEARILRVDRDSTRNKRAWKVMRDQIYANEVDVLVGTQMLSKGHDFPALTLVGVINPDSALYSGDFRAPEKIFAQLVQVSGRAGRAEKSGEVLIQTAFPDHPLFRALQNHDYEGWAASQLAERQMAGFPPFVYQVVLRAEGKKEQEVYRYLNEMRTAAVDLIQELFVNCSVEIFDVVPAAMPRRANHVRAQLLVQSGQRKYLQQFLRAWQHALSQAAPKSLRCSLDVDPLEY